MIGIRGPTLDPPALLFAGRVSIAGASGGLFTRATSRTRACARLDGPALASEAVLEGTLDGGVECVEALQRKRLG
jgi:hypothetical protein